MGKFADRSYSDVIKARPNSRLAIWSLIIGILLPILCFIFYPIFMSPKNDLFKMIFEGISAFVISGLSVNLVCFVMSLVSVTFRDRNVFFSWLTTFINFSLALLSALILAFAVYVLPKMGRW